MARVELCYFVVTFTTIVFSSIILLLAINAFNPNTEIKFNKPVCDENNTNEAFLVGDYNTTTQDIQFTLDGLKYGCPCSKKPCIPKCCPWGQTIGNETIPCGDFSSDLAASQQNLFFNLKYYTTTRGITPQTNNGHFNIVFRFFEAMNSSTTDPNDIRLMSNGTLERVCEGNDCYLDKSNYCLDTIEGGEGWEIVAYFIVQRDKTSSRGDTLPKIDGYVFVVSGVFFLLTFLIYASLSSLQNLSGKCLMCYFVCMTITSGSAACQKLLTRDEVSETFRIILGLSAHCSALCSFFWINVINFDLWLRISGRYTLISTNQAPRRGCTTRFTMYSVYAWGCPVVVICVTLLVEYCNITDNVYWKPDFFKAGALLNDGAYFIFYYIPLGVLVCHNTVLFVMTVTTVQRTMKKKLRRFSKKSKLYNAQRERLQVCLKLMPVMGMYWIFELLLHYLDGYDDRLRYIFEFFICIQGIIVFIIFACKRNVLSMLSEKYCPPLYNKFFYNTPNDEYTRTNEFEMRSRGNSLTTGTSETVMMSPD